MMSSKLTRIAIAVGVLSLSGCASLQSPTSVDEVQFQDPHFAQCVYEQGEMQLDKISTIECNEAEVTSVDEIRYMPELAHLVLLKNKIEDIDTSHNPKLVRLIVGSNNLTQIDLSNNPELISLNVSNNQLTHLDVSDNPALKSIYAYKMPLAEIDVSQQAKLRDLGLSKHQLTQIDLSNNPELMHLNLSVGTLGAIDLSHNPKLGYLYLSSNQLTELDLSRNTELQVVNLRNNKLSELELNDHHKLRKLKADYNKLSAVDLSQAEELAQLELNNNQISELNLSQHSKLKKLTAFNNPLHTLQLSDDNKLELLSVEATPYALAHAKQAEETNISNLLSPRVSIIEGGVITRKGNQYHVSPSQLVTPSVGQYIGIRYSVSLPKDKNSKVDPKLANQQQFPITVRMTHPEIIDPNTGKGFTVSTWPDTMFKHNKNLAMWYFGNTSEMVSGRWTLEILYRDSVVAKRSFNLVNMDDPKQLKLIKQSLQITNFVKNGDKILCGQEKFRSCFGFDNAASCQTKLKPYKHSCQLAAAEDLKQTGSKGTGKDAFREYFHHFTVCVGSDYIKNNKLDPEPISQCFRN